MNIAWILPHLELYGGVRRGITMSDGLLHRGHDVTIFTKTGEPCTWRNVESKIEKLSEVPKDKFDVVIFTLESQFTEPYKFNTSAIVYYILHYGVLYKEKDIARQSYQQPFYLLANSNWTADNIEQEVGKRPAVVFGGIDTSIFYPIETTKRFDVLTYGDNRRNWKGREDVEEIQKNESDLDIGYMSDIDPAQDKIAETYCQTRVFFSASWFEGWNWMGLEAMACGVPVVITRDGGSADYAEDGKNCIVVSRDREAATNAIRKILSDKELQKKFIANGLETVKRFTWERSIDQFERHLKNSIMVGKI